MASQECLLCRRPLNDGEKVVRVETVVESLDASVVGTTGFSPHHQEFIHLDHLKRAAIGRDPALPKAGHW